MILIFFFRSAKTLKSEEEIDAYVEKIRTNMKQLLKGCDGIKLN